MSLEAHFRATCDGCGKVVERHVPLNDQTIEGIMYEEKGENYSHTTYASDMWTWALPEGWLQVPEDEVTGQKYLFFHDGACYKDWLRKQGRIEEVKAFENTVWVA